MFLRARAFTTSGVARALLTRTAASTVAPATVPTPVPAPVQFVREGRRMTTQDLPVETVRVLVNEDVPGGGYLEVDVYGAKGSPPVILLHGGGQTRHSWARTAQRLAQSNFCAIAVDMRGHGNSYWDPQHDYSYDAFGRDLIRLTQSDLLKNTAPAIVGASLGGLTLMAAGPSLGQMSAAVFVDILPKMQPTGVDRILTFMYETSRKGFATVEEAVNSIEEYMPNRKRQRNFESVQKNLRQGADGRLYWHWDPAFLVNRYDVQHDDIIREVAQGVDRIEKLMSSIRAIKAPILLIRGQHTDLIAEEDARAFINEVPGAEYIDVQGAAHMVAGDSNDVFSSALIGFLKRKVLHDDGNVVPTTPTDTQLSVHHASKL